MKRLFLLILISCFPLNNIFGMDKPPVAPNKQTTGNKVPLVLNAKEREISQMNWRFPLDQNQLDDLISVANKGDYQMQYLLGLHYMHGYTPTRKKDFVQAEKWLLLARKNDYLPAYTMLVDLAMDQNNFEKWISYAREAAQRGFLDQNYNVGIAYKLQKKYKKAQEFFEETIKDLQPYQDDPNFKWVRDGALVEMANLLKKGQLGFKDTKKAMDIFKELASSNNIQALYFLALAYLYGNEVIQKNPRTAESLLLKIEQSTIPRTGTDKIFYLQALNVLGWMFENGLAHNKPDLNKAIEYYKKEYDYAGKFHIARLILAGKIQGNSDQAKKILESASEGDNPNTLAAFLYGTILISEGEQERGLLYLEKVSQKKDDTQPIAYLQLGIAYHYGFGVEQNEAKAREYFQKILNDPDPSYRSLLLARGYMYLFGLGGLKKDITKGLALISESENKLDDVYFETDQLLPAISKLRAEQAELIQKQLIGQESEKKAKKKKKRAPQSSLPIVEEAAEDDPFQTTEKEWNEYFGVDDGSYVSLIDKKNKVFVIADPKREQQLMVKFEALPDRDLTDIAALKYHKRILERQGHAKRRLKRTTRYNHDFAEMLDYVIQYLGESVPFVKDGSDKRDNQLIATVIRKDLKTGKETINKAEYTFGQKGDDIYVYHRLLRPMKVAAAMP